MRSYFDLTKRSSYHIYEPIAEAEHEPLVSRTRASGASGHSDERHPPVLGLAAARLQYLGMTGVPAMSRSAAPRAGVWAGMGVLVLALLVAPLLAPSVSAASSVFATGMQVPESITQTPSGFVVTDANGTIWSVPSAGGTAVKLASVTYSLRGGLIFPASFRSVSGRFLVVGGVAEPSTPALASSVKQVAGGVTVSPYASQANSLWTEPVFAPNFGSFSGDILVTNQGSGQEVHDGSVDFFTPNGKVGELASLTTVSVPFGAALAPSGFGTVGGTLLVSDAGGPGIYSVTSTGDVTPFATVPLGAGQSGLRQMAFAPSGWGPFSGDLFVSVDVGAIDIVDKRGHVVAQIPGSFRPRGLLFTTMSGNPSLLFSDVGTGQLLKAGRGDVVEVDN